MNRDRTLADLSLAVVRLALRVLVTGPAGSCAAGTANRRRCKRRWDRFPVDNQQGFEVKSDCMRVVHRHPPPNDPGFLNMRIIRNERLRYGAHIRHEYLLHARK